MFRLLMVVCVLAASACAPSAPDVVLINGHIFTADPTQPWVEAVAIRGDRIVAVGDTAAIAALAGPGTVKRDLAGFTVVPGFDDAHTQVPAAAAGIQIWAADAVARGVTSSHVFSDDRPVAETAAALVAADTPMRFRVLRAPRVSAEGVAQDSRPHLPPQPSLRVDVRGMSFVLGAEDETRIRQVVGWAYGSEDPLAVHVTDAAALTRYVEALERAGLAEVWRVKRPRLEQVSADVTPLLPRLATLGVVIVQTPGAAVPLRSVLAAGVTLALGSGGAYDVGAILRWSTVEAPVEERLTREQTVTALTRGASYAELSDKDKGHVTVGALADLAVLSANIFTLPPERLGDWRSVLTIIGGRVVYDVP